MQNDFQHPGGDSGKQRRLVPGALWRGVAVAGAVAEEQHREKGREAEPCGCFEAVEWQRECPQRGHDAKYQCQQFGGGASSAWVIGCGWSWMQGAQQVKGGILEGIVEGSLKRRNIGRKEGRNIGRKEYWKEGIMEGRNIGRKQRI